MVIIPAIIIGCRTTVGVLYWYVQSFLIGNNKGVYWDNFFFHPTANTVMTGAYRRDDGTLVPSTGIWGLRELARRTFQMMNEHAAHHLPAHDQLQLPAAAR